MATTERQTWQAFRDEVKAAWMPDVPDSMFDLRGDEQLLRELFDDGLNANDAIIRVRGWDARRKANRNV